MAGWAPRRSNSRVISGRCCPTQPTAAAGAAARREPRSAKQKGTWRWVARSRSCRERKGTSNACTADHSPSCSSRRWLEWVKA